MVFNSYLFFLIFLPVFLLGFFILRKRTVGGTKGWILLTSLLFYLPFGVKNCAVLALSVLVNAVLAWRLDTTMLKNRAVSKALLAFAIIANVVTLLAFKFSGFFFPIAISFYTFNQVSYLVDLYRGEVDEFNLLDYLCYILFFPKILQGPLVGYADFKRQLDAAITGGIIGAEDIKITQEKDWNTSDVQGVASSGGTGNASLHDVSGTQVDFELLLRGLLLFSMGLFKKVILADTFGKAVDFGFGGIATLSSLEAILVAVFYSFQLYFDFSGYCDMASAICMIIGFELPLNFDSPYKAVNIVDFWKRWHITLTRFFTKYVYIPLGGNRKGAARMYLNFMIVFLLSGLWHGSGWTFIIWGAMHGVLYVATRWIDYRVHDNKDKAKAINTSDLTKNSPGNMAYQKLLHALKVVLTFAYVTIAWVFFRANTASDALALIVRMFVGGRKPINTHISSCFQLDELWYVIKVTPIMKLHFAWDICLWLFVIASSVMILFAPTAINYCKKCTIGIRTTLLTALLLVWSIITFAGVSTFLYMNF